MKVELLDVMGSDLTVVNAARVSFAGESEEFGSRDKKLVRYRAAYEHRRPFVHVQVQLRIKAPVFITRQLHKHQTGLVVNEVSIRYVDFTPEFHALPAPARGPAGRLRRGAGALLIGLSVLVILSRTVPGAVPAAVDPVIQMARRLHVSHGYGLFAHMTTSPSATVRTPT